MTEYVQMTQPAPSSTGPLVFMALDFCILIGFVVVINWILQPKSRYNSRRHTRPVATVTTRINHR